MRWSRLRLPAPVAVRPSARSGLSFLLATLLLATAASTRPTVAAASSPELAVGPVRLSAREGRLTGIFSAETRAFYSVTDWDFAIELDGDRLSRSAARTISVQSARGSTVVRYEFPNHVVRMEIREVPSCAFTEYTLEVEQRKRERFHLSRVTCGKFQYCAEMLPAQWPLGGILGVPCDQLISYPQICRTPLGMLPVAGK